MPARCRRYEAHLIKPSSIPSFPNRRRQPRRHSRPPLQHPRRPLQILRPVQIKIPPHQFLSQLQRRNLLQRQLQHPLRAPRNPPKNLRHHLPHPQQIISAVFRRPDHHIVRPQHRKRPSDSPRSHPRRIRPNYHHLAIPQRKTLPKRVLHPRPKIRPPLRQNLYASSASLPLHQPAKITSPARRKHKRVAPAHLPHKPQRVLNTSCMQRRRNISRYCGQQSRLHFSWFGGFCKYKEGARTAHGRELNSLERKATPRKHSNFR